MRDWTVVGLNGSDSGVWWETADDPDMAAIAAREHGCTRPIAAFPGHLTDELDEQRDRFA